VSTINQCPASTTNYFKEQLRDPQPEMYVCLFQANP